MDEKTARQVRMLAMQLYSHKKGAISNAINSAIQDWLAKFGKSAKQKNYHPNWSSLRGALGEIKMTSVALQHATTKSRMHKG